MNQQQKKYATERLNKILSRRQTAIRVKHTKPAVNLTPTQRMKAFRAGKYKITSSATYIDRYNDDLLELVVFDGEAKEVVNNDKIEAEWDALTVEFNCVMDELMLGDAEEAIKLIKAFDK